MTDKEFLKAAFDGDLAGVRSYVESGGDINVVGARGLSALMLSIWTNRNPDIPPFLLDHSIDLGIREPGSGWRAITYAAVNGHAGILRDLFARGDGIDCATEDWKALLFAAQYRNAETVAILLDHGVPVDTRDNDGKTSLMRAAANSDTAMLALLLERGADPTLSDNSGTTALMYAARKAKADNIRLLLAHGADPAARDNDGRTALDIAEEAGKKAVAAVLRETTVV